MILKNNIFCYYMNTNFCNTINIRNKVIKCISEIEKKNYVFMNIYFLEMNFEKDDIITWSNNNDRFIGTIEDLIDDNIYLIKRKSDSRTFKIPTSLINKIHPIHETIMEIEDNIKNNKEDIFENINDEKLKRLMGYIDCKKSEITSFLFVDRRKYETVFIYDEMINEDDTNDIVLSKICKRCFNNKELNKYVYVSYIDNENGKNQPIGFNYDKYETMKSPIEILSYEICDLIENESNFTDINENNFKDINDKTIELFENNKIMDNNLYVLSLDQYLDNKEIKELIINQDLECDEIIDEIKLFKNRIVNKYWPFIKNDTIDKIVDDKEKEKMIKENLQKLKEYSIGNNIIYGEFLNYIKEPKIGCDFFEINYMRIIRKDSNNAVDLYKLFTELRLSSDIPYMKWVGSEYDNKYYKIHRDSMIYDGFDSMKSKNKTIDIKLCKEWSSNYYRNDNITNLNQYELLHKTDLIFFKVCSDDDQNEYCTLVIHINGDIEFIIKKNESDLVSISRKEDIIKLFNKCNGLISKINELNIYSSFDIITFGKKEEIDNIFTNDSTENIIDFIDYNIYFNTLNYAVVNGITQKEMEQRMKSDLYIPYTRPFVKGDRVGLYIPLLKNLMKNLSMFFRYMVENNSENGDGVLSGHYKKVNNYANRNTIQSAISAYSNIGNLEVEEIINILSNEFGKDIQEIVEEYESWEILMKSKKERGDKIKINTKIEEDGPDVTISEKSEYLLFEIKDSKSFNEMERIIITIKTMMNMFYDYINNDERFNNPILKSYFEGEVIKTDDYQIEEEESQVKSISFADFMDTDDDDTDDDDTDDGLSSDEEESMGGGGGAYDVRSYALKRLKSYDKPLFTFKSEKFQVDKKGKQTQTRYGYPKLCQASKGLGSRQPIVVTEEELETINQSTDLGSGPKSYSQAIEVPGREVINGKRLKYICPQYWDVSKQLSIRPDSVNKEDIIPETLPTDGRSNKFILERKGTFWDGIPPAGTDISEAYKYYIPRIIENTGIHPDGYGLPCCFSLAKGGIDPIKDPIKDPEKKQIKVMKKKQIKGPENLIELLKVSGEEKKNIIVCGDWTESEEQTMKRLLQKYVTNKKHSYNIEREWESYKYKINTKRTGIAAPQQCSQIPIELQQVLYQDLIFKYDPDLIDSNGFIRKGVVQNNGIYIFKESSFINSLIEINDYEMSCEDFINNEIILKFENNIDLFQKCSTIHKTFRIDLLSNNDISYIIKILKKQNTTRIINQEKISTMIRDLELIDISDDETIDYTFNSNHENYILRLILSLKKYIEFLKSNEEKDDTYIIPVLNVILDNPINIIIFEMINDKIKTKKKIYNNSDKYCFIYKNLQYYEPLIYRINSFDDKEGKYKINMKIFSREYFEKFGPNHVFKTKDDFFKFVKTPYPRGRQNSFRSGISEQKLMKNECKDQKFCKNWLNYNEFIRINGALKKGILIKWNNNVVDTLCEFSGKKEYASFIEMIDDEKIKTSKGIVVINEVLFYSETPTIDDRLTKGITNKKDWIWIDNDCNDIKDRDIEALIRKKEDKIGDKLLLKYSIPDGKFYPKDEKNLINALKTNFFLIRKILDDIEKITKTKQYNILKEIKYDIKYIYINRYSDISYVIALKDGSDILIPVVPSTIPNNNEYDIIYDIKEEYIPKYNEAINYLSELNRDIDYLLILPRETPDSDGIITSIILKDGTYLPIKNEKLSTRILNKNRVIESSCKLKDIDDALYKNQSKSIDNMDKYIDNFNNNNKKERIIYNHILNLIKLKENIIDGSFDKSHKYSVGDKNYFKKIKDTIVLSSIEEYQLNTSIKEYKIYNNEEITNYENVSYGEIIFIDYEKNMMKISTKLIDTLYFIIKDKIVINKHKKDKLLRILYKNDQQTITDNLFITTNEIFKVVPSTEGIEIDDLIELTKDGKKIKNVSYKDQKLYKTHILISEKDTTDKIDLMFVNKFINKLITIVLNGKDIFTINKTIKQNIKLSYIEKTTPKNEIFFKYSKDKDKMNTIFEEIFSKKSEFIDIFNKDDLQAPETNITRKLIKTPYYINKLYGDSSILVYSIDSIEKYGSDWYNLTQSLKSIKKLNLLKYQNKKNDNLPDVIDMIINGLNMITDPINKDNITKEYNNYGEIKSKLLNDTLTNFNSIDEIKQNWLDNYENTKILLPDMKLLLTMIEKKYENLDLGILMITYNYQKKNDIHFLKTKNIYKDTPVITFCNTIHNNNYVLSSILIDGKQTSTIEELYSINDHHYTWIPEAMLKIRPCTRKKNIISNAEDRITELHEEIDREREIINEEKSKPCE